MLAPFLLRYFSDKFDPFGFSASSASDDKFADAVCYLRDKSKFNKSKSTNIGMCHLLVSFYT